MILEAAADALLSIGPEVTASMTAIFLLTWLRKAVKVAKATTWRRKRMLDGSPAPVRKRIRALIKHLGLVVKRICSLLKKLSGESIALTLSVTLFVNVASSSTDGAPLRRPVLRDPPDIVIKPQPQPQPRPPLPPGEQRTEANGRIEVDLHTAIVMLDRIDERMRADGAFLATLKKEFPEDVLTAVRPELDRLRTELNYVKAAVHLIINIIPYVDPAGSLRPGISPLYEAIRRRYWLLDDRLYITP